MFENEDEILTDLANVEAETPADSTDSDSEVLECGHTRAQHRAEMEADTSAIINKVVDAAAKALALMEYPAGAMVVVRPTDLDTLDPNIPPPQLIKVTDGIATIRQWHCGREDERLGNYKLQMDESTEGLFTDSEVPAEQLADFKIIGNTLQKCRMGISMLTADEIEFVVERHDDAETGRKGIYIGMVASPESEEKAMLLQMLSTITGLQTSVKSRDDFDKAVAAGNALN